MAQESTVRQFIIGTLILGAIIAGGFTLLSFGIDTGNNQYQLSNNTLNKFDNFKDTSTEIQEKFPGAKPDRGAEGILSGLIEVSWGALKNIWNSFDTMSSLISDLAEGSLGIAIPSWLSGMFIAIIGTIIAFALMAAWFKWHI